ncbi:MAG: ABC transporter permease [Planctomycetes bacterium]|nr:ABC transporter permease [Planctomycetota bacterium]
MTGGAPSPRREAWRRLRGNPSAMRALAVVGIYGAVGLYAEVSQWSCARSGEPAPYELRLGSGEELRPPSLDHFPLGLLGTDHMGRSVLLLAVHATRVALIAGLAASILATAIGAVLGCLAGFFGKLVDEAVVALYTTVASIPSILLVLALGFALKKNPAFADGFRSSGLDRLISPGLFTIAVAIGLSSWVTLCRLLRAEIFKLREMEYVVAARSLGTTEAAIAFRHVLPNAAHIAIVNFSLLFVFAVKSEVVLSFLGLGVDAEPSWGRMIADARVELARGVWWGFAAATGAIFGLLLAVNVLGDALRDALDPRMR